MNYKFEEISEENIWKSYEESYHDFDSFFQSWEWGEFEKTQEKELLRIGIYSELQNLVGVISAVVIQAKRGKYIHVRNGPLFDWNNSDLRSSVTKYLKDLAVEKGCSFVRISPLLDENSENKIVLKELGFVPSEMHDVDAETVWVLDVSKPEEVLLSEMRTNTRYHINRKRKENIEFEVSENVEDLEKFMPILNDTVKRQKWNAYSSTYLENEFKCFAKNKNAFLVLAKVDGVYVAGAFLVIHKGVVYRHHAASLSEYRKLAMPYLVEWKIIQEIKKRGLSKYNMMGIARTDNPKHPWTGLTFFKKGFGGIMEEHLHAHDLPVSPRYWPIHYYELLQRKLKKF